MAQLSKRFERIAKGEHTRAFDVFVADAPAYLDVPLEQISPDRDQPRKDLGDLEGLKASIAEHGVLQPIIVSPAGVDRYTIISGERRYTAARQLGLPAVPAVVRTVEEHRRLELQLVENLHRKDLDPFEEAQSYLRLRSEFGLTQEEVGRRIGKSVASINETLRLLDLPSKVREEFRTSENVSKSLLLEIVKRPEEEQERLWEDAKKGGLTVKRARQQKAGKVEPRAKPAVKEFKTTSALVTIRFRKSQVSAEDVLQALRESISQVEAS
jgi:ParB family transcriptional regulator, chromosome partitioning protein